MGLYCTGCKDRMTHVNNGDFPFPPLHSPPQLPLPRTSIPSQFQGLYAMQLHLLQAHACDLFLINVIITEYGAM